MIDIQSRQAPAAAAKGVLYLLFHLAGQRFALDVREVVEVLPLRVLKPIAHAPHWVAGILAHRGELVPVIDVGALAFGAPAPLRTSTRLVLVHYRADAERPGVQLGLILAQATDTLRCQPGEFHAYGLDNTDAPYLGPVRQDTLGLLQRIRVDDLLPAESRTLLFPAATGQVSS